MVYGPTVPEGNAKRTLTLRFDVQRLSSNSVASTKLKQSIYFENSDSFGQFLNIGLIEEISYSPSLVEDDRVVWLDKNRVEFTSLQVVTEALKPFGRYIRDVLEGRGIRWHTI